MKNKIYLLGIIAVILFTTGAIFKIMHFFGAGIILTVSLVLFILIFTPLAIINAYKAEKRHAFVYVAGLITIMFNFTGALFKIMHWPGAGVLLLIAIIIPFILFLPAYLMYLKKKAEKNLGRLISVLFVLSYFSAMNATLALNVSKNVIDDSILIHDHYALLESYYETSVNNDLQNADSIQHIELMKLSDKTENLIIEVHALKKELLSAVAQENFEYVRVDGKMNLRDVLGIDNRQVSGSVMIGENRGVELKSSIEEYKNFLNEFTGNNNKEYIKKHLNTNDIELEGNTYTWEQVHFEGTMLIWAINNLTSLEFRIRMIESEIAEDIVRSE
jgi:hypothetical protein